MYNTLQLWNLKLVHCLEANTRERDGCVRVCVLVGGGLVLGLGVGLIEGGSLTKKGIANKQTKMS